MATTRRMYCWDDLSPGKNASEAEALRQRIYHIVFTSIGALPQDPTWGLGIQDALARALSDTDYRTLEALTKRAIEADPQVTEATVTITKTGERTATVDIRAKTTVGDLQITETFSL